jgi:predicted phage tail protein
VEPWQILVAAIGMIASFVAISGTVATWVVSSVRAVTNTLAETIRALARSMDDLRRELREQRDELRDHDRAIAVLQTQQKNDAVAK